jgi:hypothetical protein
LKLTMVAMQDKLVKFELYFKLIYNHMELMSA